MKISSEGPSIRPFIFPWYVGVFVHLYLHSFVHLCFNVIFFESPVCFFVSEFMTEFLLLSVYLCAICLFICLHVKVTVSLIVSWYLLCLVFLSWTWFLFECMWVWSFQHSVVWCKNQTHIAWGFSFFPLSTYHQFAQLKLLLYRIRLFVVGS